MGTSEVRLDPKLNQAVWARGVKTVPHRIRVKLESASMFILGKGVGFLMDHLTGKRNDEENAKEKLFTYASYVPVTTFKVCPHLFLLTTAHSDYPSQGLENTVVDAE
jgi:large subunit ribosomal protein L31e